MSLPLWALLVGGPLLYIRVSPAMLMCVACHARAYLSFRCISLGMVFKGHKHQGENDTQSGRFLLHFLPPPGHSDPEPRLKTWPCPCIITGPQHWLPLRPSGSAFPPPPKPLGSALWDSDTEWLHWGQTCVFPPRLGERKKYFLLFLFLIFQDSWTVAQAYWQITPLIYAGDDEAPSVPMIFSA